jgi:hypothetical protein
MPIKTGPGVLPASYTVGTWSFPGVKWPEHGTDLSLPSSAEVKDKVGLYLYSPSVPSRHVTGRFTLPDLTLLLNQNEH